MFLTIKLFLADVRFLLQDQPNPFVGALGSGSGKKQTIIRTAMQVGLSIVVTTLCVAVVCSSSQSDGTKKLAFTALGTVLGYWLR